VKRRHPFRGFFGGLLLGLGVALLMIFVGFAPMGEITPWVVIVLGIVIGLLVAFAGPTRGHRGDPQLGVLRRE
jgi:multisubunit Na+/H+ antiporter MnhB subunit